ncbi:MAG: hypothetical protein B6245_01970 [Desulfobacteraceae bacterium 4572_88]|nr:MAG: hypothetical protein B6245_01970 [Desulfobacteraceae bacterium 4572_88]
MAGFLSHGFRGISRFQPGGVCKPVRSVFPPPLQGGNSHDPDIPGLAPQAVFCRRFAAFRSQAEA